MTFGGSFVRGVFALLVCLMMLLAVPGLASAASASDRYEASAIKWTNKERTDRDRVKLKYKKAAKCVDGFAERWAKKMATKQKMYHQKLGPIMDSCDLSMVGENIAYGFTSGKKVVNAWMHSPGHKENILRPKYRLIGLGAYKDDNGIWWVSQVFGRAM
ncbi:hypothetical protein BH09ACT10_BH09ACT10_09100 [soil metagenome]